MGGESGEKGGSRDHAVGSEGWGESEGETVILQGGLASEDSHEGSLGGAG